MKTKYCLLILITLPFYGYSSESKIEFSSQQICKAGISTNTGRKPKIMSAKNLNSFIQISYTRNDGKQFKYLCKIDNQAIRWKDQTMKAWNKNIKLSYNISKDGKNLIIKTNLFGDISTSTFSRSDF